MAKELQIYPGVLDLLVLSCLVKESMHGYDLMRRLAHLTAGRVQIDEGSLYPSLHRLAAGKLVSSYWGKSTLNRKAKYYRISPLGRKRQRVLLGLWKDMAESVASVIGFQISYSESVPSI